MSVPSAGIGPASQVPQTCVLSIELRGLLILNFKNPIFQKSFELVVRDVLFLLDVLIGTLLDVLC